MQVKACFFIYNKGEQMFAKRLRFVKIRVIIGVEDKFWAEKVGKT